MEFIAATKEGIVVYDALSVSNNQAEDAHWKTGKTSNGTTVKAIACLPSPPNAFGHIWSDDGEFLASVCDAGVRVYKASDGYTQLLELEKVAPDVGGRAGGVRNVRFSPGNNFLVTYEKWDPQYLENVHLWVLQGADAGKRLHSCQLKGYTSGALPVAMMGWSADEGSCVELVPGKGLVVRDGKFGQDEESPTSLVPEKNIGGYVISPVSEKGTSFVACFVPEVGGNVARVAVYNLSDPAKPVTETYLPAKVKDAKMVWNFDGSALTVLANSDVDETGCSYFGTTYLYWMKTDGKSQSQIYGSKDGQVQDVAWSPVANEFVVVVGFQPATVALHDGKTGKLSSTLGKSRRNTVKWNPFGRFIAVGGFGTLAGDLDFFDRSKEETVSSLRAPLTVDCAFGPDGRHFLACTVAPRMNEGNQISMYKYTGEQLFKIDYVPDIIEGRHEDTGAGARTKTQALLYAASWRPDKTTYTDTPATPRPAGAAKRKKGLPEGTAAVSAFQVRGSNGDSGGSSLVAAMMRGEVNLPTGAPKMGGGPGWDTEVAKPLEEWEIKKLEKERLAEIKKKEAEEVAAVKQKVGAIDQAIKEGKKRLKEIKKKLEEMEALKDKDWDELTEEDEAELEGEIDLRAELQELEKKFSEA